MARAPTESHAGDRVTYRSPAPVYQNGRIYDPGEKFATASPKLDEWTVVAEKSEPDESAD